MPASSSNHPPVQGFQFRIATLLIAMVWVGLISLGLRTPTAAWSGAIAVVTLTTMLSALLAAIRGRGKSREMAVGYLLFAGGYFVHVMLARPMWYAMNEGSTSLWAAFDALFDRLHPGGFAGADGRGNFTVVCHHAIATLLGVLGATIAQFLYATRKPDPPLNGA